MTAPSLREAVARAINKLHPPTCDGPGGCSCTYECERWNDNYANHLEDADAALAVALPIIKARHASLCRPQEGDEWPRDALWAGEHIAAAIRADEGPK